MIFLNQLWFVGEMIGTPERVKFQTGSSIVKFNVLYESQYMKKDDNIPHTKKTLAQFECWGKVANYVEEMFRHGDNVFVNAHIEIKEWKEKSYPKHVADSVVYAVISEEPVPKGLPPKRTPEQLERDADDFLAAADNAEKKSKKAAPENVEDDLPF